MWLSDSFYDFLDCFDKWWLDSDCNYEKVLSFYGNDCSTERN